MLRHLINAAFRPKFLPDIWKAAEQIMIQKPGKKRRHFLQTNIASVNYF